MPLVVPELIWFAVLLFAFGVVYTLRKFMEAMLGTLIDDLGKIPVIGGKLAGLLKSAEQAVANALGSAENAIDSAIGSSFHALGRLTDWLWREFKAHSVIGALLAKIVGELLRAFHAVKHEVHHLTVGVDHTLKRIEAQERRLQHGIDRLTDKVKSIEQGIGDDVLPRLKSLDREITRVTDKVIPNIRSIAQGAENDVIALRKWVTDNVPLTGTIAFTGAVAWALSQLGLGGLRCPSFLNLLKKHGCGLGTLLNDLLGLAVAGLVLEGVCEFLPWIEAAFGAIAGPLTHLLNEVPLGACEQRPKTWANLSVAAGPLPPGQTLGPLAQ